MPKIELISKDESFELGDEECRFILRRIPAEVMADLRKRNTSQVEVAAGFHRPQIDQDGLDKDMLDYAIQDWRGVVLADGSEAPCTREHKWSLPFSVRMQILAATQAVNRQGLMGAELKNLNAPSVTAPGGASTPSG